MVFSSATLEISIKDWLLEWKTRKTFNDNVFDGKNNNLQSAKQTK